MTLDEIREEWERTGKLSRSASQALLDLLESDSPFEAITVVGDLKLGTFADEVAQCVQNADPMIRWNAISVLTTSLKSAKYGPLVLKHAVADEDELVRGAALAGLGLLIPYAPKDLQLKMRKALLNVFSDEDELVEMRGAAYEGMLEALGVDPRHRPSAARLIDLPTDVDEELVARFKQSCLPM